MRVPTEGRLLKHVGDDARDVVGRIGEIGPGLVVALALIPEAISFSIIVAGVDPRIGLFASFTMAVTIAIVGGRPAMISAATGAIALVVAPLSHRPITASGT